jgi:hypothetical protein
MGFVNREDGKWNRHQWNWPEVAPEPLKKKAFHIETKDEKVRKDANLSSLQAPQTIEEYISPELKGGNQKVIRQSNLKLKKNLPSTKVKTKTYNNLKFCEANMAMYLNSLDLGIFNPNNNFIFEKMSNDDPSDEVLTEEYNTIINNYNKKDFDPTTQSYIDGNGNSVSHTIKTIEESKLSPVFPTLEQYIEQNRLTGRKAAFTRMLEKRGIVLNA